MFKDALEKTRVLAAAVLLGGCLAGMAGTANAEELTVYGGDAARSAEAAREAFQAEMRAASRELDLELRRALVAELKETMTPHLIMLASSEDLDRG